MGIQERDSFKPLHDLHHPNLKISVKIQQPRDVWFHILFSVIVYNIILAKLFVNVSVSMHSEIYKSFESLFVYSVSRVVCALRGTR